MESAAAQIDLPIVKPTSRAKRRRLREKAIGWLVTAVGLSGIASIALILIFVAKETIPLFTSVVSAIADRLAEGSAGPRRDTARQMWPWTDSAGIAAGHPATAAAGLEILRAGGSAADAAVAATLASCVAETVMTGLAGGGHAI